MPDPLSKSLFDDDQDFSLIETLARTKAGTKAQLEFQRLVAKIEHKREQLRQWQAYLLRYNRRLSGEVEPLRAKLRAAQRQMAELIDELLSQPAPGRRLGARQRAKLRQLLMQLVDGLLEGGGDEAVEALHDKYSDVSHAQASRSEMELTEALLNDVFGLEIGDDHGASSTEELLQHAQRKIQEHAEEEARRVQDRQTARAAKRSKASTAKAEAAQAKREQAAKEVGQSVREVYRKLASALHPDREQDTAARQRKTQLMQRVNQAYEAKDLLTLLTLQLEIEQIDAAHLSGLPPQRVAHYNEVLREQLTDLEAELDRCVLPFRNIVGWGWGPSVTPAAVDKDLSADLATLRGAIREIQGDLVAFRDPVKLRDILKHYVLEPDDPGELRDLADILEDCPGGPSAQDTPPRLSAAAALRCDRDRV